MTTDSSEPDKSLSVKKKRRKWAKLFVTTVLAVYKMVRAGEFIDDVIHGLREWLTNL